MRRGGGGVRRCVQRAWRIAGDLRKRGCYGKAPLGKIDETGKHGQVMIEFQNVSFSYGEAAEKTVGDAAAGEAGGASCAPCGGTADPYAGVRDVNLRVGAGECVLLVGGSGCGKTTVTRLANGLAPSFFPGRMDGCVLIDGRDAAGMESWEVARAVGSVFQNPRTQFFNVDSTGEVAFALESQGLPEEEVRARTQATIAELGIGHLADRGIFSLSGGEKQRIAYASVWAAHPGNLVLDEPTSNLDEDAIKDLRRYVISAKRQGVAVLVAEHRLWWLADVADEVILICEGRVARRMSGEEFRALDAGACATMGLRVVDLRDVRPCGGGAAGESAGGCDGGLPSGGGLAGIGGELAGSAGGPAVASGKFASGTVPAGIPLLRVEHLSASYGKRKSRRQVLADVSFSLYAGEVVALVGRNGAGKTTLSRTLAGLHREDGGRALLNGAPVTPKERLARCAMVLQDVNYQLFAESVRAEVTFGLEGAARPDDERVDEILDELGLLAYAERHPHTLSGGQKQRLAIAACVAGGKDVLIFDEPTSGLDLASCMQVAALLRELAGQGRAVMVVTHDPEFMAAACSRVLRLEGGRICG